MPSFRKYRLKPLCMTGCGRPAYAEGLCRPHRKEYLETGTTSMLPLYRRPKVMVRFLGLRMDRECAALIRQRAQERSISPQQAAVSFLEEVTVGPFIRLSAITSEFKPVRSWSYFKKRKSKGPLAMRPWFEPERPKRRNPSRRR